MERSQLYVDYLVVGAGIAGLGFVDVLLKEDRNCTVAIADLFEKPGGKYNRWPSFCSVDGPIETWGVETKKFEGSTVNDILKYCQEVLRGFIESGRVRFFPRHKANETGTRLTHVLDSDCGYDVCVTRKVVDATCTMPRTQLGPKRDIEVDCSAQLVSPCSMPSITSTHSQYVVIGSGYIGTRTVMWLLSAGVSPKKILWVAPRLRRFMATEGFKTDVAGEALINVMACLCTCPSLFGFGMMMEEAGLAYRPGTRPDAELFNSRCLVSKEDISMLRKVTNVIRLGYVRKIATGHMLLDGGRYETADDAMYIDCTGSRMRCRGMPEPVWQGVRIKLQRLQEGALTDVSWSVGMIGMLEARHPLRKNDTVKNALCTPVPFTESLADFILCCIPQTDFDAWKRKDLQRFAVDRMGMRVNPVAKSREQLKFEKNWSDVEMVKKITNNVMRIVAKEDPEAMQNFKWLHRGNMTEPSKFAKVDASAQKDTDSILASAQEASPRHACSSTNALFDFDALDQVDIA